MTKRSLGVLAYPSAEITSFNGSKGEMTVTLSTFHKKIQIQMTVHCIHTLVKLAREGTNKQREYALMEWKSYKHLKELTGSTPPEGETDG